VSVPAKTPQEIKERIAAAVREAVKDSAVVKKMGENSYLAGDMTTDALQAKVRREYVAMGDLLRAAQIRIE
jgi:tripartite-type tricarboxylate transporter receptor subunit TctC